MNYIHKRRLLKLADLLDTLPPERFDYQLWVGKGWKGKPDLSCGTTACAMGWATTIPSFRRAGLRLFKGIDIDYPGLLNDNPEGSFYEHTLRAGKKLFGLEKRDFEYLFLPEVSMLGDDATAHEVAEHIRSFVKTA